MPLLPEISDFKTYESLFKQDEIWLPVMQQLCRQHGLPASELQRCTLGSAIVYRCAGRILKLFAPLWPEEFQRERLGLASCQALSIPVPRLFESGQYEGWDYLIIQALPGVSLGEVWKTLPQTQQYSLMQQAGEIMRALHRLPLPQDEALGAGWPAFMKAQSEGFVQNQTARGLDARWTAELNRWLQTHLSRLPEMPPVLLHSDLTGDHFLAQEVQGQWRITGLIDFGDLMQGHPLYEFGAPLIVYTRGRQDLRHRLLTAYGLEPTPELGEALFTALLLHRFLNMPA
ncbi:MAG: aminoglycoside 3'-phosphotransferase/choline kinase family protein [Candidatus Sericytochromatia bacterium]|nr:aminoglycoside 3'-phosphotransferase/choline kinase family protein [Candidatus Sericytochromatia bacterium]